MEISRKLILRFLFIPMRIYWFLRKSLVQRDLKVMLMLLFLTIKQISNLKKENLTRLRSITIRHQLSKKLLLSWTANKLGNSLLKIIVFYSLQLLHKSQILHSSCMLSAMLRKRFFSLISQISYLSNQEKRKNYIFLFYQHNHSIYLRLPQFMVTPLNSAHE